MKHLVSICIAFSLTAFGLACAKNENVKSPAKAEKTPSVSSKHPAKSQPATAHETTGGTISVLEAAACRSVQDRSPVGTAEKFGSDVGRIYLFSKVGLDASQKSSIKHVWRFNGKEMASITLPVQGPQWRTYSSHKIEGSQKGEWQVDVLNEKDTVLKSVSFKIE
jgi:hypothetical protein